MFTSSTAHVPSVHFEDGHVRLPSEPASAPAAGREHAKAGNPGGAKSQSRQARPMQKVNPPTGGSASAGWPERYALKARPLEYSTTDKPGVFMSLEGAQTFIVHDEKAYAVTYDKDNAGYRVVDPDEPSRPAFPVRVGARGEWEMHSEVGLQGGGRTSGTDRTTDARGLPLSQLSMASIASDLRSAQREWRHIRRSQGLSMSSGAEAALTPRDKLFIQKWHKELSAGNFAELMKKPRTVIDAYMNGDEYNNGAQLPTAPTGSFPGPGSSGRSMNEIPELTPAERLGSSKLPRDKVDRIIRMLTSNPTMSYTDVAHACSSSSTTVKRIATLCGQERGLLFIRPEVRSELMDDFMLFPETPLRELADEHRLRRYVVQSIYSEFKTARKEWNRSHKVDLQEGRPELHVSLEENTKGFIRQWSAKLSPGSLSLIMQRPQSAIDAYLHSNEYRGSTASSAAARPGSPQPGPSGLQIPLTSAQKEEVRKWGSQGMLPDSLSMYLDKPQSMIEAYMQTDEYQDHVRNAPANSAPATP